MSASLNRIRQPHEQHTTSRVQRQEEQPQANAILKLQSTVGNRAVQRLLGSQIQRQHFDRIDVDELYANGASVGHFVASQSAELPGNSRVGGNLVQTQSEDELFENIASNAAGQSAGHSAANTP